MRNEQVQKYNFQRIGCLDRLVRSENGPTVLALGSIVTEISAGAALANGKILPAIALASAGVIPLSMCVASVEVRTIEAERNSTPGQQG